MCIEQVDKGRQIPAQPLGRLIVKLLVLAAQRFHLVAGGTSGSLSLFLSFGVDTRPAHLVDQLVGRRTTSSAIPGRSTLGTVDRLLGLKHWHGRILHQILGDLFLTVRILDTREVQQRPSVISDRRRPHQIANVIWQATRNLEALLSGPFAQPDAVGQRGGRL